MSDKPLLESSVEPSKSKETTYEVIQALFFLVAFSTGLGVIGSTDIFKNFGIRSLLADFFIMVFVVLTYAVNHHITVRCCEISSEKYNYAEFIEDLTKSSKYKFLNKAPALIYDALMTVQNIILLAFIQQRIGGYLFGGVDNASSTYAQSYYSLALINIPLIFISLTSDFKKIKWFCIVMILAWIYIFIGEFVDSVNSYSSEDWTDHFSVTSPSGFGSWVIKLVGFQIYFAGAFHSIPFIYKEVKSRKNMTNVINFSAVLTLIIYITVYFYTTLNIESAAYAKLNSYGLVLIGACLVLVNIIPARFSLAQFLAANDSAALNKSSSKDKLLAVLLIITSIILSLFMVNEYLWNFFIGLGVILSSFLGVFIPPFLFLATKDVKDIISSPRLPRKIGFIAYLSWAGVLAFAGIVGGFFIIIGGRDPIIKP
jgi:hypothetical protein